MANRALVLVGSFAAGLVWVGVLSLLVSTETLAAESATGSEHADIPLPV